MGQTGRVEQHHPTSGANGKKKANVIYKRRDPADALAT